MNYYNKIRKRVKYWLREKLGIEGDVEWTSDTFDLIYEDLRRVREEIQHLKASLRTAHDYIRDINESGEILYE